jgi:DNA gyrase/topoisomerase IV subunit A
MFAWLFLIAVFFFVILFFVSLATMQKYNKVEEILNEFYPLRLKMYQKRKLHQLKEMNAKLKKLKNKTTFLTMVSKGEINLINRKKIDLEQDLLNLNFIPETNLMDTNDEEEGMVGESTSGTKSVGHSSAAAAGGGAASATTRSNFDYLLRTPLSSITLDHVEASIRETESLLELKSILENTKEGKGRGAWCCRRCCGSLTWDIIFFACLFFCFFLCIIPQLIYGCVI